MAEASIPVDLFNPGQVFACMGFLEAADVLCGDAEGGFDWSDPADVQFSLRAQGGTSPILKVLEFLATADIKCLAPLEWDEEPHKGENPVTTESFPSRKGEKMALPIRLKAGDRQVVLDHWADGSSRNGFNLYAGNRSAYKIACDMLDGKADTRRIKDTWKDGLEDMVLNPFNQCTPMGGSFNFDPRGAWTAMDAGYSPNTQYHEVLASPLVEILAAWGLEHARPDEDEYDTRQVRYGVWGVLAPPMLARPALAGVDVAIPARRFELRLDLSGKNKVVTFAREVTG